MAARASGRRLQRSSRPAASAGSAASAAGDQGAGAGLPGGAPSAAAAPTTPPAAALRQRSDGRRLCGAAGCGGPAAAAAAGGRAAAAGGDGCHIGATSWREETPQQAGGGRCGCARRAPLAPAIGTADILAYAAPGARALPGAAMGRAVARPACWRAALRAARGERAGAARNCRCWALWPGYRPPLARARIGIAPEVNNVELGRRARRAPPGGLLLC